MACTDPTIRSPGSLGLEYVQVSSGNIHRISWRLNAGIDITNIVDLETEAERLADTMTGALTSDFHITGFFVKLADGSLFVEAPFASAYIGDATGSSSMQEWESTTIAFTGSGIPIAPGACHGNSISRLFTGDTYNFPPGSKRYDATTHAGLLNFITGGINASPYIPADFYGQPVYIGTTCPVQWNAQVQGKHGS